MIEVAITLLYLVGVLLASCVLACLVEMFIFRGILLLVSARQVQRRQT